MTTLKDYVLNHRCPNCGLEMQEKPPTAKRSPVWLSLTAGFVTLDVLIALVAVVRGEWNQAAFFMASAVFLVVTDK